ncbi:M20/M25/M40 family metallo-hydrolase [Streptococcus caprae]|uniref:M20/M25/M40 family metallo-hydrolase n=1 Tax=Streptococcus caprae TaxID=1640501 RepID=A0ABV8CV80_9STRE
MEIAELKHFIDAQEPAMLALTERLINIDSGTRDAQGIRQVHDVLVEFFDQHGLEHYTIETTSENPVLVVTLNSESTAAPIIFIGHTDTVFPKGTVAQNPFRIDEAGMMHGPGIVDMKTGDVIGIFTLLALREAGYTTRPIKFILVSDEENLHMFSNTGDVIRQEAKDGLYALNFETGYLDDGLVVGRKGGGIVDIEVKGIAAHSGHDPEKGRSAILELAHKIIAIEGLNDLARGKLLNCGKSEGGTGENIIPDTAKVSIGIRFDSPKMRDEILAELEQITQTHTVADVQATLSVRMLIEAMETTTEVMDLYQHIEETAREIGYGEVKPIRVGGASDSGILVSEGIPTVCALGAKGSGPHTMYEIASVVSLTSRTFLNTMTVLRMEEKLNVNEQSGF